MCPTLREATVDLHAVAKRDRLIAVFIATAISKPQFSP